MIEEFRCEYIQTQPKFANLSTATEWAMFRAIFCLDEAEKIRVAWYNKGWAKIVTTKDWDKIRGQVAKQPKSEINSSFS